MVICKNENFLRVGLCIILKDFLIEFYFYFKNFYENVFF